MYSYRYCRLEYTLSTKFSHDLVTKRAEMPVTLQTAENEYKKNPDIKKQDIAILQEWLKKNPHLPEVSEVELIVFYHSCENSMELTKTTIDNYFTLRTQMPDYFTERDPYDTKNISTLDTVLFAPLPQLTPEGYKVIFFSLLDYEPTHVSYQYCVKTFLMLCELCQREEGTYPGFIILVDMDHIIFSHMGRVSVAELKKTLYYLQMAMPVRLKGFHFMNAPPFMDTLMGLMKPFMNKKLLDLIKIHTPPNEGVYKHVPKESLPKEQGGNHDTYAKIRDDVIAKLRDNRDFFLEEEKRVVDESKRQGAPSDASQAFGVDGTFKKLNFD